MTHYIRQSLRDGQVSDVAEKRPGHLGVECGGLTPLWIVGLEMPRAGRPIFSTSPKLRRAAALQERRRLHQGGLKFRRNVENIRMLSNKKFFNVSGHRGALRLTGVFSKKTARGLNEKEVEPVGDDRISCPADILAYETSLPWQRIKIS